MKCKKDYYLKEGKCVKKSSIFRDGIPVRNKIIRYVIIATFIILAFIFVINPSTDTLRAVGISMIFLIIGFIIYSTKEYQDDLIGIRTDNFFQESGYGVLFAVGFIIISSLVPFFSLAYPSFPASIGYSLQWFLVVVIAPITETILFQGAIFAFFRNFNPKNKLLWIILVSLLFSLFHLGSYIFGFYTLSGSEGLEAFTSNISAFITAFIFSFTAMIFALRKDVTKANAIFIILVHLGLNIFAYSLAVVGFI